MATDKPNSKMYMKTQRPGMVNTVLMGKNKQTVKTNHEAVVIKGAQFRLQDLWHKQANDAMCCTGQSGRY